MMFLGIGRKFNRLTVIGPVFSTCVDGVSRAVVVTQCECGSVHVAKAWQLKNGIEKSCGCIVKPYVNGRASGVIKETLYRTWSDMKQRCTNPKTKRYPKYGGRGISVCQEWASDYLAFKKWALANGWSEGLTIDRKDNNGNYEPGNCRFLTREQQNSNTSRCMKVTAFSETKAIKAWSRDSRCSVSYRTLCKRIYAGWKPEQAILEPPKTKECA